MGAPSPTVLVLDDDPDVRESMALLLRAYGYSPLSASNLEEARRVVGEARLDALILDVRLGSEDTGLDFLCTIREQPELDAALILVLTGAALTDAEEALITRMRAYLFQKPEGFNTLLQFLDTLTGRDQEH